MDIQTSGQEQGQQEQGQQEHNDKVEGEVVVGRKQLKPNVVNISFKHARVKEDCKGTIRGRRCSSGRLRELGYVSGGSEPGCDDGQIRVRSTQQVRLDRNG